MQVLANLDFSGKKKRGKYVGRLRLTTRFQETLCVSCMQNRAPRGLR